MNDNFLTYGDIPAQYSSYKNSKIVFLPVPYDKTSTWRKGSEKGPEAIIEASANMELYDIETDSEVYKVGMFTDRAILESSSPEKLTSIVKGTVSNHLKKNKFVVTLGGDHTVSIGAAQAYHEKYEDLTVLQLDAHADLRERFNGSQYNHACVMKRIKEFCPVVQVGIRSMDSSEKDEVEPESVFLAEDIYNNIKWHDELLSRLSTHVYITIDLDVFDISVMPSTGTPEPGGLLWYDVLTLLKVVSKNTKIVGFDIVELCPDQNSKPYDFLAAKLIYKLLSYKYYGAQR